MFRGPSLQLGPAARAGIHGRDRVLGEVHDRHLQLDSLEEEDKVAVEDEGEEEGRGAEDQVSLRLEVARVQREVSRGSLGLSKGLQGHRARVIGETVHRIY